MSSNNRKSPPKLPSKPPKPKGILEEPKLPSGRPQIRRQPETAQRFKPETAQHFEEIQDNISKARPIQRPGVAQRPEVVQRPGVAQRPEVVQRPGVAQRPEVAQRLQPAPQRPKVISDNLKVKQRLDIPRPPQKVQQPEITQQKEKLLSKVTSTSGGGEMQSSNTRQKEGNAYSALKPKTAFSIGSIRSSSGLIMIINTILILMAFLLAITWRSKVTLEHRRYYEDLDVLSLYFIGSLLLPLLIYVIIYIKQLCSFEVHIASWFAASMMSVLCFICSIFILVSSSILLKEIKKERICIEQRQCEHLTGTTIMGLIIGVGVFAQSFCHFTERKVATSF